MAASDAPRVTVTIPTYNRAHMLPDAIRSVLEQSLTDIEVFVSDNASTDDTEAVVASFTDPRLHYVRNETNIGALANMSRGLRLGTAPVVTILPDDDMMLPENLERKIQLLDANPKVGVAHSASQLLHVGPGGDVLRTHIFRTGGREDEIQPGPVILRRLLTDWYWINFPTALIRRPLVGEIRFDTADGLADDLGMFMRVVRRTEAVGYIAEPLVNIRMHAGAVSTLEGFHEFQGDLFHSSFIAVANIGHARERFLAEHGSEIGGVRELRAESRRWMRGKLLQVARRKVGTDASGLETWRVLREAARVEPSLLYSSGGMRFLAGGLLGPGGRAYARRIRRRLRGSPSGGGARP